MVFQNVRKGSEDAPQGGCEKIAMLTDFVENNRQKCAGYFPTDKGEVFAFSSTGQPEDGDLVLAYQDKIVQEASKCTDLDDDDIDDPFRPDFNFFVVRNVDVRFKNGYSIRKLRVTYGYGVDVEDNDQREYTEFDVFHYWFPDWPDHRSPDDIDALLDISLDLLDGDCTMDFPVTSEPRSPVASANAPLPIIHCSAGIGRTGCLAAILNGLRQMRLSLNTEMTASDDEAETRITKLSVDILGIVCNLRLQRGGMVQNSGEFSLVLPSLS